MRKIIVTSKKFEGRIRLWYLMGILVKVSFEEATLTVEQITWWLKFIPVHLQLIPVIAEYTKANEKLFTVIEEIEPISFDDFYKTYNYKEGKQKALKAWNNMHPVDQMKAYLYIGHYKAKKKNNSTALAYPATYLNQKVWED